MLLHDNYDPNDSNWRDPLATVWLPRVIRNNERVKDYIYRARNLLRHVSYQARGHPSGIHGLLHQCVEFIPLRALSAYCPQIPHRRLHTFRCPSHGSTRFPLNRKVNRFVHLGIPTHSLIGSSSRRCERVTIFWKGFTRLSSSTCFQSRDLSPRLVTIYQVR